MAAFEALTREQREAAIRRMKREGYSEFAIASACRIAVEAVRTIVGEPRT